MRQWQSKRYWIVGASAGLGRAVAHELSKTGAELILSARNGKALAELAASLPGRALPLAMDVADPDSVAKAAAAAGKIDGLVYLAGVYWPMNAAEYGAAIGH